MVARNYLNLAACLCLLFAMTGALVSFLGLDTLQGDNASTWLLGLLVSVVLPVCVMAGCMAVISRWPAPWRQRPRRVG